MFRLSNLISRKNNRMKIRAGFVSNSSSSSFVLNKNALTDIQIYQILNYNETGKYFNNILQRINPDYNEDEIEEEGFFVDDLYCWNIEETEDTLKLQTSLDNFNMEKLFNYIGVPGVAILDENKGHW